MGRVKVTMLVVRRTRPPAMATGQEMRCTLMIDQVYGDQLAPFATLDGSQSGREPPSSDESSLISAILGEVENMLKVVDTKWMLEDEVPS